MSSGDNGTTSTIDGRRVKKYDTEIKLYGYIDGAIVCAGVLGWDDIQVHLHKTFAMIKKRGELHSLAPKDKEVGK